MELKPFSLPVHLLWFKAEVSEFFRTGPYSRVSTYMGNTGEPGGDSLAGTF